MRICFITNQFPPYFSGGDAKVVEYEANCLAKNGHEVYIITNSDIKFRENITLYSIKSKNTLIEKIRKFFGRTFDFDIVAFIRLRQLIKKISPDILHIHNASSMGLAPYIIAKWMKIPVLHTAHDPWIGCPLYHKNESLNICKPSFVKCAFCLLRHKQLPVIRIQPFRNYFLKDTLMIAPSIFMYNNLNSKGYNVRLLRNAVLLDPPIKIHLPNEYDKFKLLFVGRLTKRKGILDILHLIKQLDNTSLFIVGDGPLKNQIMAYIINNNLSDRVIMFNDLSSGELSYLYQYVDSLILFSSWENAPLTILEGLAAGKVIIASNLSSIREITKKNFSFLINDITELHSIIYYLSTHKKEKNLMKQRAKRYYLTNFTLKRHCEQLISIYSKLVANNPFSNR